MNEQKLFDALDECYRRAFKEAEPSADIKEIIKSGEGKKPGFFLNYYLDIRRQEEIIDEVCAEFKLKKWEAGKVAASFHLGAAPRGFKEKAHKRNK